MATLKMPGRFFSALALAVAAAANAGTLQVPTEFGGPFAMPTTSLKEKRFASTLRQQYDFSCGSAALATLLTNHYGFPVSEQQVFEVMYEHGDQKKIKREGFSLLDMKLYLARQGFDAEGYQAPLDSLSTAKVPAIVLVKENGYLHFVVVKGLRDGQVVIGDPASGTRIVSRARFEQLWANRILFVIRNRLDRAGFNLARDWSIRPRAPVGDGLDRGRLDVLPLQRPPMDF